MDRNMEKERITIRMEINILETGSKIKRTAMEYYSTPVELSTTENGLMTRHPIKDKSSTPTKTNMKAIS